MLRRILPFLFVGLAVSGCSSGDGPAHKTGQDTAKPVYYPYRARMNVDPISSNNVLTLKVLQYWKGFEAGNIAGNPSLFADSVTLVHGKELVKGSRESVLKFLQQQRSALGDVQCYIDFWNNVQSEERKETWVLLWAQVVATRKNPLGPAHAVHQLWKFDPQGRVYYLHQYVSRFQW